MPKTPTPTPGIAMGTTRRFGGLSFEEVYYASGLVMPVHDHREIFLDLCLMGQMQDRWGAERFVRGVATLNAVPAGIPHTTSFLEEARSFQIVLTPHWQERIKPYCRLAESLKSYDRGMPIWIAMRLYREFQQQDSIAPLMLEGLLLELLAQIARQSPGTAESNCPHWMSQVQDYLHAHFTETLSLETLAATVGVHPSHLMRSFQSQYHCTIGEYVRRLRIEYASHLLSSSDTSSAQIAVEAGFADQSHFSHTFKRFTGMNPIEFRKVTRPQFRNNKG
jgi:AraC family transcriptional regulator